MLIRIFNYILRKLSLDEIFYYIAGKKYSKELDYLSKEKKIFFLMTPSYGNLGDQAIEIATDEFLRKYFPEYKVIKIHIEDVYKYMAAIQKTITEEDLVIIQGGGNFGSYYGMIEKVRCFIFSKLRNYMIFSMPSSVTYEDTKYGKNILRKTKRCVEKCKALTLVSRDKYSYEFCLKNFLSCNNLLSPDMVFYHRTSQNSGRRNLLILCLRTDKEERNNSIRKELIRECFGDDTVIFDTRVDRNIDDEIKKEEVESVLNLFKHAYLVITDRLHGMIFSAITGTKCVVMPSADNKIKGAYEWISKNENVMFIDMPEIEDIMQIIRTENSGLRYEQPKENTLLLEFEKFARQLRGMIDDKNTGGRVH